MINFEGKAKQPPDGEIVIIVSKFNGSITERLLDGALARLRESAVNEQNVTVCRVPGAFEIPIVATRYAEQPNILAIICLGVVIKGETPHDEHINRAVSLEIAKIGTDNEVPTIFGLLTCNTVEQAIARSGGAAATHDKAVGKNAYIGNKGYEAAEAALEMIDLMQQLPSIDHTTPLHEMTNMFAKLLSDNRHISSDDIYETPFRFDEEKDSADNNYYDEDKDEQDFDDEEEDDFDGFDEDDDDGYDETDTKELFGIMMKELMEHSVNKKAAGKKPSKKKTAKKNKKKRR
ncbi:MAG: 6,7-dimethyl-8-ribityllumazine synthase [Planctomycetaceae bacterium]|jgi:6,7-dimethyl-8-ribityllumazine synthase|nr:6,7-dimethyl-8-ribityllumazine synthase [Planctomycetaceae bacterium]